MAKKNNAAERVEQKAQKTVKDLLEFYGIGVEANEAAGEYGSKVDQRMADKYGRSPSNISHARSFAKLIDEGELDEICELRNRKGQAFGPGMATKLFPLKSRKDRRWALREWQNGASARGLKAKIAERLGVIRSERGGRKSRPPASEFDALRQIHHRCSDWLRWNEQLGDPDVGNVSIENLPTPVQGQLRKTIRQIEKLRTMCESNE